MADKELIMEPFDLFEEAWKKEEEDANAEERVWTVYVHIVPKEIRSLPDRNDYFDKYYVGITSKSTTRRWGLHGQGYKNQAFGYAIEKYGWENIQHEIIAEHLTKDEACELEDQLIIKLGSYKGGHGYNREKGGIIEGHDSKEDLTGQIFGRLTVLGKDPDNSENYICQCSCENHTIKSIYGYNLTKGLTQSCGCLQKEIAGNTQRTHDMSHTRLYKTWQGIKAKCYTSTDKHYNDNGALGIRMYEDWINDFQAFYDWAMTTNYDEDTYNLIDRIDKSKDWEPSNCQWLTLKEKANRKTNNVFYTYKGKSQNLNDWAIELGVKRLTLYARIHRQGMTIEEAFETPVSGEGSPSDKKAKRYKYNGETHTLREWSEIYNIDLKKLQNRISRDKWSITKTLDYYLKGSE